MTDTMIKEIDYLIKRLKKALSIVKNSRKPEVGVIYRLDTDEIITDDNEEEFNELVTKSFRGEIDTILMEYRTCEMDEEDRYEITAALKVLKWLKKKIEK